MQKNDNYCYNRVRPNHTYFKYKEANMAKTTTTTHNTDNGDNMNKRSAFDTTTRMKAATDDGFNLSSAADIGLKVLVGATCGVVLYKTIKSDS